MLSVVDALHTVACSTDILPAKSLPNTRKLINEIENFVNPLTDRFEEPSEVVHGNVRSGAPIIIYFGPQQSSLRGALITYLAVEDITVVLFSIEQQLWQWLDLNSSLTVVSLVLQPCMNIQEIIYRSHTYVSVRSMLVRCRTTDLAGIQRFSRIYEKVNGIFDDDTRLLIKLVFDLSFFSEDLGDQQMENENNEMEAQRNYDRVLKLCALVQTL